MANQLCKAKGQYTENRTANVRMSRTVFTDLYTQSRTFRFFWDCKGIFHWPFFSAILLFFAKALHLGKTFSVLFITDLNTATFTRWKVSDRRHIGYLICVSNARVLTRSVKIDQSEGIPDPGIPERPFVKFSHKRSLASSRRAFFIFSRPVFCVGPWLTERLEEAIGANVLEHH